MRSTLAILVAIAICGFTAACDDDDNGTTDETATPGAAATASTPGGSPTTSAATPEPTTAGAFIEIDEPAAGADVTVPFDVSGSANVFEAALQVDVLDAAGTVLCARPVQATSGTGTPGTWETTMAFPPPAGAEDSSVSITVRAYNFSARDGSIENEVQRDLMLSLARPNIVITSPSCSEEVPSTAPLVVEGDAIVFEAALSVDIRNASGDVLLTQNVLALSGVERSPWTATFDISTLPAGSSYEVVAYSFSARDGSVENVFAVPFVVSP